MSRWIKIFPDDLMEWEWYKDQNTKDLFLHCLYKANWKDGKFKGKDVLRGSFVTSVNKLSEELCLTISQIKTAIKHLILTNEIAIQTYAQFSIITVNNYNKYQVNDKPNDKQIANESQTLRQLLATIEEYKNIEDIKKEIYNACASVNENNSNNEKPEVFDYDWMEGDGRDG